MRVLFCTVALAVLTLAGCADYDPQSEVAKYNDENIKRMVSCYTSFCSQNAQMGYKGPKDEDEFMKFLHGDFGKGFMKYLKLEPASIDSLLISERDGQPFKFRWGVRGGRNADAPVVFEDTGVDGKRMVGFLSFKFVEAGETEYKNLLEGKYQRSPVDTSRETGPEEGAE